MSDAKRIVIGSEIDDTKKVELDRSGSKIAVPVTIYDSAGNQVNLASGLVPNVYDSLTLSYTGTNLTKVVYKLATLTVATLTLAYDASSNLTSVTKS